MHRIFGEREPGATYTERTGAYLIDVREGRVSVIQTGKGYFLPGGGLEADESDEACIRRECLEETGYAVQVGRRVCSAESYCVHPEIGHFHPVQRYYAGRLTEKMQEASETDHRLARVKVDEIRGRMFSPMQSWALEVALDAVPEDATEDALNRD